MTGQSEQGQEGVLQRTGSKEVLGTGGSENERERRQEGERETGDLEKTA